MDKIAGLTFERDLMDKIIDLVYDLTSGTNIEVYDYDDYIMGNNNGLKFDLFDHLDKVTDFESDIEALLLHLDEKLGEDFLFSHSYSPEMEICDIDGEIYPDYHCYLKIYQKVMK